MESKKTNLLSSKTLDYFLCLTETMNYTKAAQKLGISQPALTQQIKKIEKTIGTPLFYSIGKKLHMTEAGYTMVKLTNSVYNLLNDANDEIQQITKANEGIIQIGMLSSIEDKAFIDFFSHYYTLHPRIKIVLSMLSREEIWDQLENNVIDLAIMYLPDDRIKNWKVYNKRKIADEELLFLHQDETIKDKKAVKLKDTLNYHWVVYPKGYYIHDILENKFTESSIDFPHIAGYFSTPAQLRRFSGKTGAYTALPKSYIEANRPKEGHYTVPFDPSIYYQLAFVYRKDKEMIPRITTFLDEFDRYTKEKDYAARLKE